MASDRAREGSTSRSPRGWARALAASLKGPLSGGSGKGPKTLDRANLPAHGSAPRGPPSRPAVGTRRSLRCAASASTSYANCTQIIRTFGARLDRFLGTSRGRGSHDIGSPRPEHAPFKSTEALRLGPCSTKAHGIGNHGHESSPTQPGSGSTNRTLSRFFSVLGRG